MNRPVYFASDLHLCVQDPATLEVFLDWLGGMVQDASALYLLGDLFEYWVGDDDRDDLIASRVAAALCALTQGGTQVYLMHGNRDFLIGAEYLNRCGATLLPDPCVAEHHGRQLLLSHGDALCTDDVTYQQFRSTVRQTAWQAAFLARPLAERQAEAARLRAISEAAKADKAMTIMDVNAVAVNRLLAAHPGTTLVHGHTHRPARHVSEVQHALRQRWVLPDWHAGRGGALRLDAEGLAWVGIGQAAHWGA